MRRRRRPSRSDISLRFIPPLISLIIVIIGLIYLDSRIRPIVESMASYQARLLVVQYINNSITTVINDENISSADVVKVTVGQDGTVSSIQTDMVTINRLKADITRAISEDLQQLRTQTIRIPMGNLSGIQLLSGRGPRISFEVIPSSFVQSNFVGSFNSAGINQSIHRINIEISTSVLAIVPGYSSRTEVKADFCVAETVIVGNVPNSFTELLIGDSLGGSIGDGIKYDFISNSTK